MQYEIMDATAIELARDFYEALADGLPTDAAVNEALTQVQHTEKRYYEAELYRLKGALKFQSKDKLRQVKASSKTGVRRQRLKSVSGRLLKTRASRARNRWNCGR
ncbi:MAG: hypothetical protein HY268_11245 [Deltaproteobacteria bacterium]|nr:hypothetical protein [Deltaproteobacteria bacterium]